jgi:histidinol-phosphate aminotransferase
MEATMLTRRELGRMISGGVALAWAGSAGPAAVAQTTTRRAPQTNGSRVLFRLSSNENNYGLAPAAIDALRSGHSYANRYGGESIGKLTELLAKTHNVSIEHVLLTPGSGEILRAVTLAFTGPTQSLVMASPTFESPGRTAKTISAPVKAVPVAADGTLDLKAMAAAASGGGLAFVCNPNNPTGGINSAAAVREFVTAFRTAAPDGYILIDEAYFDYVTDSSYATAIPLVQADKRIIVSRTFSKIHGMAGLRVGYAIGHPDTLALVRAKTSSGTLSSVSAGAALASLIDVAHLTRQRALNQEARLFTRKAFEQAGYTVLPSEGNFVMVNIKRDAAAFQDTCREAGVAIARPFPPLTTYARITIGTVEDMKKAVPIMLALLSTPPKNTSPTAASSGVLDDAYGC